MTHPIHPACAKWPWPSDAEFTKLVEGIRTTGLIHDIWLTRNGQVLDGKVREKACEEAGVEPRFKVYEDDDPVGFTISQNAQRRHMPRYELAFLIEELAMLQKATSQHKRRGKDPQLNKTIRLAAKLAGLGTSNVESARAIKRYGAPYLIELAKAGKISLRPAAAFARHTSTEEQEKADIETITRRGRAIEEKSKGGKAANVLKRYGSHDDRTIAVSAVIEALRPLVNRVKEQSRQHIALVSLASLSIIASAFEKIFEAWAKGDDAEVHRIARHIAGNYVRNGNMSSNNEFFYRNQEGQQRDPGSDPGPRH